MITVHDTNATFVKFILTMQYSVSEVKNTASKMLRFGMPNVLPLEITFLFRNHKLGSFSSSLFTYRFKELKAVNLNIIQFLNGKTV